MSLLNLFEFIKEGVAVNCSFCIKLLFLIISKGVFMSISKYMTLSLLAGLFIGSEIQAPGRQNPPARKALFGGVVIPPCQGEECYNGAAPVTQIPDITDRLAAEAAKPLTPKQQVAQLKKNISLIRKNIFETVDLIAKGDLGDKAKLLQNILSHEQQSLTSLQAHLVKQQPLRQPPFPGCPICG
jgi:hypothetical protein